MKKILGIFVAVSFLVFVLPSCSFTLNGASTVGLKTIYVGYFDNNAPFVVSNLSQNFTEALKARIRSTTNLNIIQNQQADAVLTGTITGYSIAPVSIQATTGNTAPIAGASALTITVEVKYVNNVDKKLSYEQSFSEPGNFTGDLTGSKQDNLITTLNLALTEDIFNKAFASW
ncbi:Lipopolysaccharide-assembly [Mucilaginibacter mallensis]|uniref:Lipopolysaccharide-assembly n=1 Tax=Mucilaginibacter mallensis TaxID=652787 RepID=A0A1H1NS39_MUCMA|nr:LptE family protein [Mucilaginibacter mallensis]SDS01595.1 Lipopolysaccharide-assembly [Mucilaginibacter mallensis]